MSTMAADPSTREEIEAILKEKIESGDAETGLYDTGLCYVVVDDILGEGITFQWFESAMPISDLLTD